MQVPLLQTLDARALRFLISRLQAARRIHQLITQLIFITYVTYVTYDISF